LKVSSVLASSTMKRSVCAMACEQNETLRAVSLAVTPILDLNH
jgi:hypothetical protein